MYNMINYIKLYYLIYINHFCSYKKRKKSEELTLCFGACLGNEFENLLRTFQSGNSTTRRVRAKGGQFYFIFIFKYICIRSACLGESISRFHVIPQYVLIYRDAYWRA